MVDLAKLQKNSKWKSNDNKVYIDSVAKLRQGDDLTVVSDYEGTQRTATSSTVSSVLSDCTPFMYHGSSKCTFINSVDEMKTLGGLSTNSNMNRILDDHISTVFSEATTTITGHLSTEEQKHVMEDGYNQNKYLLQRLGEIFSSHYEDLDMEKLSNHWEYKSTRLLQKCLSLEGNAKKQSKAIRELDEWKRTQEERIVSFQKLQQKGFVHHINLSESKRPFAGRVSEDPSFRTTMKRLKASSKSLHRQIQHEAKIELAAIEERLACSMGIAMELKKELVSMTAVLHRISTCKKEQHQEFVYFELSCKKCQGNHMKFVGIANDEQDLEVLVQEHFCQVVKLAQQKTLSKLEY